MFLSRNKKNNEYPCKPQFYYIKVGFKGSKLYRRVFVMYIKNICCVYSVESLDEAIIMSTHTIYFMIKRKISLKYP